VALRVGFIGLGNIGKPMARRLVAAGLETYVLDAVQARQRNRAAIDHVAQRELADAEALDVIRTNVA